MGFWNCSTLFISRWCKPRSTFRFRHFHAWSDQNHELQFIVNQSFILGYRVVWIIVRHASHLNTKNDYCSRYRFCPGFLAVFTNGRIGGEVYQDPDYHLVRCALGSPSSDRLVRFFIISQFHSHYCSAGPVIIAGVALGIRAVAMAGGMHLDDNHMVRFIGILLVAYAENISLEMGNGNLCAVLCASCIWRRRSLFQAEKPYKTTVTELPACRWWIANHCPGFLSSSNRLPHRMATEGRTGQHSKCCQYCMVRLGCGEWILLEFGGSTSEICSCLAAACSLSCRLVALAETIAAREGHEELECTAHESRNLGRWTLKSGLLENFDRDRTFSPGYCTCKNPSFIFCIHPTIPTGAKLNCNKSQITV